MKVVISDLHLMDRSHSFLFNTRKELVFSYLCNWVREQNAELVLAGDVFDLTGLTPCERGTEAFFNEAVPLNEQDIASVERHCRGRTVEEILLSTKATFPLFFESLKSLADEGRVTYIPGNHDCAFLRAQGRALFAKILEVGADSIRWTTKVETQHCIIRHGNEFDAYNQTFQGCRNPGFAFTSGLYQAVIPALRMLGVQETVLEAIPAVRPEEATVIGLQFYLGEDRLQRLLVAFSRLLQRNGYFQGLNQIPAWFLSHDFPILSKALRAGVTPERIRLMLPKEEKVEAEARIGAAGLQAKSGAAKMVVLGHTHELDLREKYVNLGTWIDHLRGLHPDEIANPEVSIPVLAMNNEGTATLYDATNMSGDLATCPVLWTGK